MPVTPKEIQDFFQKYLLGWMCTDIEKCITARANLGVAALLMTYTENIGSIIAGNLGLSRHSHPDFNKFLEYFEFNGDPKYYKDFRIKYRETISAPVREADIYEAFRCGLIHEYAPKLRCSVANDPTATPVQPGVPGVAVIITTPPMGFSGYNPPQPGKPQLSFYTNAYYRDFKNALNKVYNIISNQTDPNLIQNCQASLERIFERELVS